MTKFFNLKNKIERIRVKDAKRKRKQRRAGRQKLLQQLKPEIKRISETEGLTKALVVSTVVSYDVISKMYEPDEIDKLVKSLHFKFLKDSES